MNVQELKALKVAKKQGYADFAKGIVPEHYKKCDGGELYEAYYDGWDAACSDAEYANENLGD
jgi:hypothetical protein